MGNNWAVQKVIEVADELRRKAAGLQVASGTLVTVAEKLQADVAHLLPVYVDIVNQIPTNPDPTDPAAWWKRELGAIRGITIHHTLSHSPRATAHYVIESKKRPTLPYHFWVSEGGECWLCVPLHLGMWHDHTGHRNVNISVGMAGSLHKVHPAPAQMEAAVRLVRWLMEEYAIPLAEVQGHCDRFAGTICPGWDAMNWREHFYGMLAEGAEGAGTAPLRVDDSR